MVRPFTDPYTNPTESADLKFGQLYELITQVEKYLAEIRHLSYYMEKLVDLHTNLSEILLARAWATEDEDVEVQPGLYSALHHAAKALESAISAEEYAVNPEDVEISPGVYSALHHSIKAAAAALAASLSETAAGISETNAAISETNSAASEAASLISETNAALAESNALTSATNASVSETNAGISETNALNSANASALSETNALASENAAALSESNALISENNAAISASDAALYDGKKVDLIDELSTLTVGNIEIGEQVRCIENHGVYERVDVPNYTFTGDLADYTVNYNANTRRFTLENLTDTYAVKNIENFIFDDQTVTEADMILLAGTTLANLSDAIFINGISALDYRSTGGIRLNIKKFDGKYTQEWFGIKNNGDPHASELEDALDYIGENKEGGLFFFSNGRFYCERDLFKPANVEFEGTGTITNFVTNGLNNLGSRICTTSDGVYSGSTLIYDNIDKNTGTWRSQFTNTSSFLRKLIFDFSEQSIDVAVRFGGSHIFEYIKSIGVKTLLKKTGLYTDGVYINQVHSILRGDQTSYLIDMDNLGDKNTIIGVAAGYTGNQVGSTKSIRLNGCEGGNIEGITNGEVRLELCNGISMSGGHFETGKVILDRTFATVYGNTFWKTEAYNGSIEVIGFTNGGGSRNVIHGNTFQTRLGWPNGSEMENDAHDILFEQNGSALIYGNYRTHTVNGQKGKQQTNGIKISVPVDGMNNDYNKYSAYLSDKPTVITGRDITLDFTIPSNASVISQPTVVFETLNYPHPLQGQTVYINLQAITCPKRRFGRRIEGAQANTALSEITVNIPATVGTTYTWPLIELNLGSFNRDDNIAFEVYMSTTTSQNYDFKCLLPLITGKRLLLGGVTFAGQPWEARTAGDMDPLQGQSTCGLATVKGNNMSIEVGSLTMTNSIGDYIQGDKLILSNTTALTTGTLRNQSRIKLTSDQLWTTDGVHFHNEQIYVSKSGFSLGRRISAPPATLTTAATVGDFNITSTTRYDAVSANQWQKSVLVGEASTAELEDVTSHINTVSKSAIRLVLNSTTGIFLRASGSLATDTWVEINTAVVAHTPV